jgi:hypothetical protein
VPWLFLQNDLQNLGIAHRKPLVLIGAGGLLFAFGFIGALFVGGVTAPDVGKQVNAVFSAPIPYAFALLAVLVPAGLLIWQAMEWGYGRVIDAKQALIDQKADYAEFLKQSLDEARAKLADLQSEARAEAGRDPTNKLALHTSATLDAADALLATANNTATAISSGAPLMPPTGTFVRAGQPPVRITPHSNE